MPNQKATWTRDLSWKSLLKQFLLGGGTISLAFGWQSLAEGEWLDFLSNLTVNGTLWVLIGVGSGMLVQWLDTKIPWFEAPVKRVVVSLVLMVVYSLLVAMLVLFLYAGLVYGIAPLQALKNVGYTFPLTVVLITLFVGTFLHGRGFFLAWKAAFKEAEEHKRAALAAKYEALKNQVNPHFLFNSFNVLSNLVYKDADLAAEFIQQLSKVYRYVLETQQQELISLEQEMEMLKAYLFLLEIRFGKGLKVETRVEVDPDDAVVPLTLQMLTENAVKHNIASKKQPLHLSITRKNGTLTIENSLQLKGNNQSSLGVGLPNIQERYRYLCGQELQVETTTDTFSVSVPILQLKAQ
ncbi:MAG: histidine kinase [Phaeodactylibacter sp.]|uniref:sensor histidine kinase n=1 Tax=Phaeodactylibacter sp. TaxID=1940289 RepID=UPI0032EBA5AF